MTTTPPAPQSLDDLIANGLSSNDLPSDTERRRNGFHLWKTEAAEARRQQLQEARSAADAWSDGSPSAMEWLKRSVRKCTICMGRAVRRVPENGQGYREDEDKNSGRLSTSGLMALTVSLAGAQMAWTLELAYGTPFLLSLGLSKQATSLVWLAGPLSGLVAQPVIGSLSDASSSHWRRRKYMLFSAILLTFSSGALAFSVPVATWIVDFFGGGVGDWDPERQHAVSFATQALAVTAFWILDFALNALQASARALILDRAPAEQQSAANAWHGRMTHLGNIAGFGLGWLDLGRWPALRWIGGGQFRKFGLLATVCMLASVGITCATTGERPNPAADNSRQSFTTKIKETGRGIYQAIRHLPRPVRRICAVQFFAFMGWFPFLFYGTTYVIEVMNAGQQHESQRNSGSGVRLAVHDDAETEDGSFAMLLYAIVALFSGAVLPYLALARDKGEQPLALTGEEQVPGTAPASNLAGSPDPELPSAQPSARLSWHRRLSCGITLRTLWTFGSGSFAILMCATFFVRTVTEATVVIALVGVPWSIASWVPFAMVMEFVHEAENGTSPYEFSQDHYSAGRIAERRRSSARISRSEPEDSAARTQLAAALGECGPLVANRDGSAERGSLLARGAEVVHRSGPSAADELQSGQDGHGRGGTILGVHNLSIVLPQFVVAIVSSLIFRASSRSISSISTLWASPDHIPSSDPMFSLSASSSDSSGGSESVAWVLRFGGLMALCAAALTRYIPLTRTERLRRDEVDAGTDGEDSDGEGEGQDDDDGVAVR